MPYNLAAESFDKEILWQTSSIQVRRKMAILRFWAPWGATSKYLLEIAVF